MSAPSLSSVLSPIVSGTVDTIFGGLLPDLVLAFGFVLSATLIIIGTSLILRLLRSSQESKDLDNLSMSDTGREVPYKMSDDDDDDSWGLSLS